MSISENTVMPIYAGLNADGTIYLELGFPGIEQPVTTSIPPTAESIRLARPGVHRVIDLDAADPGEAAPLMVMIEEVMKASWQKYLATMSAGVQDRAPAGR